MKTLELKRCYKCKSVNLKYKKNLVTLGNKFSEINVLECQKCGETYYTMDETERIRRILHPNLLDGIENFKNIINGVNLWKSKK